MDKFTDKQKDEFLALAQEVGIGKAIRELGYPKSWATGQKWAKQRGIKVNLDDMMANVKKYHTFYKVEDLLVVLEEGIERAREMLIEDDLEPDEYKKVMEGLQKAVNTWRLVQEQATSISETREKDALDVSLLELLNEEKAKNREVEEAE